MIHAFYENLLQPNLDSKKTHFLKYPTKKGMFWGSFTKSRVQLIPSTFSADSLKLVIVTILRWPKSSLSLSLTVKRKDPLTTLHWSKYLFIFFLSYKNQDDCAKFIWRTIILLEIIKNGILLPKLFWPTVTHWEKIVLVIEKNFWNSRLKAKNLQDFWDQLNNLFKQWKVRTISGNWMLF